jgi:transaldolase
MATQLQRLAHLHFKLKCYGEPILLRRAAGARAQRPLWPSTDTRNPAYRDVMYVEQSTGPGAIHTMPQATIDEIQDHRTVGRSREALGGGTSYVAGADASINIGARKCKLNNSPIMGP